MPRLLIFTDLDGSLLDRDDYSYAAARPSLARIRLAAIPLVFVTSKTRSEVEPLAAEMGFDEPFITENGGGVFFPPRYHHLPLAGARPAGRYRLVILGRPYEEVRRFVTAAQAEGFPLRGFGDLTVAEVAELADLSLQAAARARERELTEPFLLADEARLPELEERARRAGLAITRGGRFFHLMGAGQDKGRAVRIVHQAFASQPGEPFLTVGVGDSPNDLPFLAVVDLPVVIPQPEGGRLELPELQRARLAPEAGSRGWNQAVHEILDDADGGKLMQDVQRNQEATS